VSPHGRLIWEGEKILILKKRKFENMLNKELFLASEDRIWGKITLTSVFPLTREQVEATRFAHKVSEEEIKKWWGNPTILYAYTFTFKKYEKPKPKKLPVGIQTFFVLKREKEIVIEFLGTGAESKWKEEITVDGKPRKYTSTLINNSILINVTPDHEKWFKQHENQLEGILFSHAHKDALASWFKQYRTKVPIYVTEELTKAENFRLSSKYKIVPERKAFEIDGIKFVYHPVKHAKNTPTYAIEIDDQIIHSEDVLDFPSPEILRNKKLWIADGSSLKRRIERNGMGHMSMFEAIELASKYNVNRVIFTQIGHSRGLSHEELHEELHKFANKHYPNVRHISIAKEGLRYHLKSDVITKRAFISTLNKPGWRIFEPEEIFDIKQISFPVAVKEKIDGMRLQVHVKDGKLQHLFSDEGHDVKDQFKCMTDDFRKYPDGIYDAEGIMLTSEGKPMHRTAFIGYAKSKAFDLDKCKRSRIRIFDVLFFKDKDVRDLTHEERLKIVHSLPKLIFVKPEITGKLGQKDVQGFIVNNRKDYLEAVKRVRRAEGSEGAIIIQLDSKYLKDTKHNPKWVKLKNLKEVDCLVAEVFPIEGTKNVFGYRICAGPYSKECGEIVKKRRPKKAYEYKGEIYAVLGKTFNTKIRVPKHRVLRIKCDEILRDKIEGTNCFVYSAVKPLVIEYVKERNDVPDSIHVLVRLAELSLPRMKRDLSIEKFVRRRGNSWCVLDSDSNPIKCYSISEFGEETAKEKANRLHRAIMASKARRASKIEKGLRKPFGHPLGKSWQVSFLNELIPEHKVYVEPFAGGASLYFKKDPEISGLEVLNDKDKEYAFALRFIRDATSEEWERLTRKDWNGNFEKFEALKKSKPKDRVERFYRFKYLNLWSVGSRMTNYSEKDHRPKSIETPTLIKNYKAYRERMKNTKIYSKDYKEILRSFDGKDTFFYLDPPYLEEFIEGEKEKFLEEFANEVKKLKGKWLLSFSDEPIIRKLFKDYNTVRIKRRGTLGANRNVERYELVIANYPISKKGIKKVEQLTPELYRELAKEGEPLPEKYYKFHPNCKLCRWVLQKHEPGRKVEAGPEKPLIEEEVRKDVLESELFQNLISKSLTEYAINGDIILKFRDHLDLRVQIGKNKAVGWALHPPQNVPGGVVGEFIRRLKSHKQTQSAAKLLMEGRALNWLDVGKKGRMEIPAGKPGASRVRTAFIEAVDWGTVKFGVQRKDLHEYFFKSKKGILEGKFIARVLKVGGKLNWYLVKPRSQLPLSPQVHKDEGYPYVILNEDLTEEILEKD